MFSEEIVPYIGYFCTFFTAKMVDYIRSAADKTVVFDIPADATQAEVDALIADWRRRGYEVAGFKAPKKPSVPVRLVPVAPVGRGHYLHSGQYDLIKDLFAKIGETAKLWEDGDKVHVVFPDKQDKCDCSARTADCEWMPKFFIQEKNDPDRREVCDFCMIKVRAMLNEINKIYVEEKHEARFKPVDTYVPTAPKIMAARPHVVIVEVPRSSSSSARRVSPPLTLFEAMSLGSSQPQLKRVHYVAKGKHFHRKGCNEVRLGRKNDGRYCGSETSRERAEDVLNLQPCGKCNP